MRRLRSRQVRWVGGVVALALMLASFLANSVQTGQDKLKVATMTGKMQTVCVGRFLIDLPAEATLQLRRGFISGYDVASTDRESDEEFDGRLAQLAIGLNDARAGDGRAVLESTKTIASEGRRGKVFVHNRQSAQAFEGERIVDIESVDLEGRLRLAQASISANAKGMAPGSGDELARLLGRFRAMPFGDIPTEPGFCLGHAIVLDPYEHPETESVVMFAGLPGHPDVNIVLSSMAGVDPAPRLLERHAVTVGRRPLFMQLAFSHLREAARAIHGLDGDELVMRVREPNFTTGYSFQWEMTGSQDDVHAPLLMLELHAGTNPASGGKPLQSTLSEAALLDLWDRIAGSLRLRPTVTAEAVLTQPAISVPGDIALARERCPQTGWWHCTEANARVGVLGGRRQFIEAGTQMPQALLLPQATVWQRIRGLQPSYESRTPTRWRLADRRHVPRALAAEAPDAAPVLQPVDQP